MTIIMEINILESLGQEEIFTFKTSVNVNAKYFLFDRGYRQSPNDMGPKLPRPHVVIRHE